MAVAFVFPERCRKEGDGLCRLFRSFRSLSPTLSVLLDCRMASLSERRAYHESAHVVGALVLLQALFMIARLPPAASTTAASTIDKGIIFIAGHLCKGFALPRPLGRITRAVSGEFRLIDCLWSQIKRVSATPKRHLAINRPCGPPPTGDSAVPRIAPNVIVGRSAVGERQLRSAKTRN